MTSPKVISPPNPNKSKKFDAFSEKWITLSYPCVNINKPNVILSNVVAIELFPDNINFLVNRLYIEVFLH